MYMRIVNIPLHALRLVASADFQFWQAVFVILLDAMYSIGKTLNFCNMLLAARFNPAKNLEKTHIRQIDANKLPKFCKQNDQICLNPYYKS